MKTRVVLLYCCVVLTDVSASAGDKIRREDYLRSKAQDAVGICKQQILATAKDPSSIQLPEQVAVYFGTGLMRNDIYVQADVMGRNTYGAVLRHQITCTIVCKQSKGGCYFESLEDQP